MLAIPCCFLLKEPKLERERIFSKRAIAFTFSEKSVYIGSIVAFGFALGPRAFSSPIGGMFSIFAEKVLGGSIELFSGISLTGVLAGIPGALIGGWASDKWGHKRMHTVSHQTRRHQGYENETRKELHPRHKRLPPRQVKHPPRALS